MLLREFFPDFTRALCNALSISDEHLSEQVMRAELHACSFDRETQIATLGIEPEGPSLVAEVMIASARQARRNVKVREPNVVLDISSFGFVHGLEVFDAAPMAEKIAMFEAHNPSFQRTAPRPLN